MSFTEWEEPFDPNATKEYTFTWSLPAGESIADAQVDFVDSGSVNVVTPTDITILATTPGQIAASGIAGNVWGVTVWFRGLPALASEYFVRCRVTTDSTPFARVDDQTMRLEVAQQ